MSLEALVPYAYGLASKLCSGEEEARDLAQTALLRAWEHRDQVREPEALKGWFRTLLVNTHLMNLRSAGRSPRWEAAGEGPDPDDLPSPGPSPADEACASAAVLSMRSGCFLAMARKLTLEQRTVFSLTCMFGLGTSEVAALLGTTPGAVKALLHRARGHLDAFFHTHCQWIDPEADCRCEAWLNFAALRQDQQEAAQKRLFSSFPDGPPEAAVVEEKRARIWALYRNLPDRTPDPGWYRAVTELLGPGA